MTLKFSKCLINIKIWQINFIAQRFQNLFCFFCSASEKFAEDLSTDSLSQGCKMDCEKLPNCELRLRIANAKKSQFHNQHNSQVAIGTFRLTQFDFLEGRNCEIAKNCEIGEKIIFVSKIQPILKKLKKNFLVIFISKMRKSQFLVTFRNCDFSQSQFDFRAILQPCPFGWQENSQWHLDYRQRTNVW